METSEPLSSESGSELDSRDRSGERAPWYRRRWTTIVLEADGRGWRATQAGVAVEGHGETAADAAADYCRRIAESGRGELNG